MRLRPLSLLRRARSARFLAFARKREQLSGVSTVFHYFAKVEYTYDGFNTLSFLLRLNGTTLRGGSHFKREGLLVSFPGQQGMCNHMGN